MKYTKGEWVTEFDRREKGYFIRNILEDGSGESIAFVYQADECTRGNAHLIAAAPAMYEVLKGILPDIIGMHSQLKNDPLWASSTRLIKEALAKAEAKNRK